MKKYRIGQLCAAFIMSGILMACGGNAESGETASGKENGTEEVIQQESTTETLTETVSEIAQTSVDTGEFDSTYNMLIGYWYDDSEGVTYYVDSFIKDGGKTYIVTKSNEPDNWYQLVIESVSEENNDVTQDQYYNYTIEMKLSDKTGNESEQMMYILENRYNSYPEIYMYLVEGDKVTTLKMLPTNDVSMISSVIAYMQYMRPTIADNGEIALEEVKLESTDYVALDYLIITEDGSPNTDYWLFNEGFEGYYCFKRKENTGTYLFDAYYEDATMKDKLQDYYPFGGIEWSTVVIENPYMNYTVAEVPQDVFSGYVIKNKDDIGYFYQAADNMKMDSISFGDYYLFNILVDGCKLSVDFMNEENFIEIVNQDSTVPKFVEADLEAYKNEKDTNIYMTCNDMYFKIKDNSDITVDVLRKLAGCFSDKIGEDIRVFLQESMAYNGVSCQAQLQFTEVQQSDFSSNGLSHIYAEYGNNVRVKYFFDESVENYISTNYDPNDPNTPTVRGFVYDSYYDYEDYEIFFYKNTSINEYQKMVIHKPNQPRMFMEIYDTSVEYGDECTEEHFINIFESMYAQE